MSWTTRTNPDGSDPRFDARFRIAQYSYRLVAGQHDEAALPLGPVRHRDFETHSADNFASYPFFFGAIQMVEADPSLTDRVVTAFHKWVKLANTMLHNGEGVEDWTATRWADLVMMLQWYFWNEAFNGRFRFDDVSVGFTTSTQRVTRICSSIL